MDFVKDIEYEVYNAFEDKIGDADIPDDTKTSLYKKLDEMITEVVSIADDFNNEIDSVIEQFTPEYINQVKDDMRLQDEKEADLWS